MSYVDHAVCVLPSLAPPLLSVSGSRSDSLQSFPSVGRVPNARGGEAGLDTSPVPRNPFGAGSPHADYERLLEFRT